MNLKVNTKLKAVVFPQETLLYAHCSVQKQDVCDMSKAPKVDFYQVYKPCFQLTHYKTRVHFRIIFSWANTR